MQEYYDRPGVLLNELEDEEDDELEFMQKQLIEFKQRNFNNNEKTLDFIGAHPISLLKLKLSEIKRQMNDWLVCEKSDGVRYLMLILSNGHVYLTGRNVGGLASANRSYQLFRVKVRMPILDGQLRIVELFDGEVISDKYPNSVEKLQYLIFDTLIHNCKPVVNFTYIERLRCAQEFQELRRILKGQQVLEFDMPALKYMPPIKICLKDFFMVTQVNYILNVYIPLLFHPNDGLIFTQNSAPYKCGTCPSICKWKPPSKNSIDCLLSPNKRIPVSDPNKGLIDLYIMERVGDERGLMLFDMMIVDKDTLKEIQSQMDFIFKVLEQSGQIQSVKGVVAECVLSKLPDQVEQMAKLFSPASWGKNSIEIDEFLKQIVKHSLCSAEINNPQFMKPQLEILKSVREAVQLRTNFKYTWKIEKYRTDKTTPNSRMVAMNTMYLSIRISTPTSNSMPIPMNPLEYDVQCHDRLNKR